jgi:hypothetical protein
VEEAGASGEGERCQKYRDSGPGLEEELGRKEEKKQRKGKRKKKEEEEGGRRRRW